MSGREDMILRPTIREVHGTDAATRSRVGRRVTEQAEGRGLFARLARRRVASRLAAMRTTQANGTRLASRRIGSAAGRSMAGRVLGSAGRIGRFMFNPATAIGVLGISSAMYATSRSTGLSLSQIGQFLNNNILGDIDDEGRARTIAAQRIASDSNVAAFIGRRGSINQEIRDAVELMARAERIPQIGASQITTEIPAIDTFELLLRALERGFSEGWESNQGREAATGILQAISNSQSGGMNTGGSR